MLGQKINKSRIGLEWSSGSREEELGQMCVQQKKEREKENTN
jgi:hypothetical protein